MIYIITFLVSTLFVYFGDKIKKRKKYLSKLCLIVAVVSVAFLAGVRDLTIGTDILTYGEWTYKSALKYTNFLSYAKAHGEIEMLFLALVYVAARIFSNSHWLYFFIGLIQYGFTLAGIINFKGKISIPLSWLCFLLIFYGDTLNAMRQFMAIAIAFWAFNFFINNQYIKFVAWTIIAILFHNTAILSLLIAGIYYVLKKKNILLTRIGIVSGALVASYGYSFVLNVFLITGLLNQRFERYSAGFDGFQLNPILIRIFFILFIFLSYKRFSNYDTIRCSKIGKCNADFLIILLIVEMITAELRSVLATLYRISFYFGYGKLIAYPRLVGVYSKKRRMIYSSLLILFLLVLWVYQNVYQGNNEIYPYTSVILGIQ